MNNFHAFKLNRERLIYLIIGVISIVIFLLLWDQYALHYQLTHPKTEGYFPRPYEVLHALYLSFIEKDITGHYMTQHIFTSLVRIFYGFLMAFGFAVPTGLAMGWSKYASSAGNPIVEVLRPIPPIVWIPFAIVFFRENGPVFIVFLGVVFQSCSTPYLV